MSTHPAVEVRDLSVHFGDFRAVDKISFSVAKGEIFGFLGANGAGKTTTIRVLCGLLVPTAGAVDVAGVSVVAANEKAVKSKVGYMSQKFTLYNDLTVGENLEFIASLRKIKKSDFDTRLNRLFQFISFDQRLSTFVKDLPGGLKQQVALVAALLHEPEIVFLDEPTAGVSPASRARFWDLIRELARGGTTIFVTSHYMDEVEQCGRIAMMRQGRLIALGSPDELKNSAFPSPLFELEPLIGVRRGDLERWRATGIFASLEPYGLKFHASIKDSQAWRRFVEVEKDRIAIREIRPSLEDVFIRLSGEEGA